MSRHRFRVRQHVNPLKIVYGKIAAERPSFSEPVEVEIGCADAQYLFGRASRDPLGRYVGIEIREELVHEVRRRIERAGLAERLEVIYANANTDLEMLFRAGGVKRFIVNFPDPWFKRRQHKRRLVTPELAASMQRLLAPHGELLFQSDVFDLALDALAVFEATPLLRNRAGEWSFLKDNPFLAQSRREVRCQARGRRIWRLGFEKQGVAKDNRSENETPRSV